MKQNYFAVCDLEAPYAYNFMELMNEKKASPFQVQAFSNVENLQTFCENNFVELLLISNQAMCQRVRGMNIGSIVILSEGEVVPELAEYPAVYKYQSSEAIINEVLEHYTKEELNIKTPKMLKKRIDIIGVYSPIKRALKTSFALTLGQLLAKDKNVLYINLEEYSGFPALLNKEFSSDLADLMYYIRQRSNSIILKMNGIIQSIENLDYIPPVSLPKDLRSVTCEEWNWLLDEIISSTAYEVIILDMGDSVDEIFQLLDRCRRIYMPVKEDSVSLAKLEQFEKMLQFWQLDSMVQKIKKIRLPFHNSFGAKEHYVEQLIWGELGDYVRNMIRDDF